MNQNNKKEIRWKQRFENFEKAFTTLEQGINVKTPNALEKQGIIKSFEFTFELAWKTLKDFLESQNVEVKFPRDVIKKAFHYELIENGEIWLDMLDKQNILTHTYDEKQAEIVYEKIKLSYFQAVSQVFDLLNEKINDS